MTGPAVLVTIAAVILIFMLGYGAGALEDACMGEADLCEERAA